MSEHQHSNSTAKVGPDAIVIREPGAPLQPIGQAGKPVVLFDADNVLADFRPAFLNKMGISETAAKTGWRDAYEPSDALLQQAARPVANWNEAMDVLRRDSVPFYSDMPATPWAKDLWQGAQQMDASVGILTARTTVDPSREGTRNWVSKNISPLPEAVIVDHQKQRYANSQTILVDDSEKNVNAFLAAGGRAVLVPDPANSRRDEFRHDGSMAELVLKDIRSEVAAIQAGRPSQPHSG